MKRKKERMANKPTIDLNSDCINYTNVNQNIIHITEDKLIIILLKYREKNKQFYTWTTPLAMFVTCLFTTFTANFESKWGLSADTFDAIFIICTLLSAIWLLYTVINAIKNRKGRKIEDLIKEIKNPKYNS